MTKTFFLDEKTNVRPKQFSTKHELFLVEDFSGRTVFWSKCFLLKNFLTKSILLENVFGRNNFWPIIVSRKVLVKNF